MRHKEQNRLQKLFYFLRPLAQDKNRWRNFSEFLQSPLHANSPRNAEILDMLADLMDEPGEVAEKLLCQRVFPGQDADTSSVRANLRRKLSPLLQFYFEFEGLMGFQADKMMQWRYVMQAANLHQWDHYFPWLYRKKALGTLESLPRNETWFVHQMDLSDQWDSYLSRQERDAAEIGDRYREEMEALSSFFAINLLKLACNMHNQALLTRTSPAPMPLLEGLLWEIEKDWNKQEILVQMYYLVLKGLKMSDSNEHFFRLEELLYRHALDFGQEEAHRLFQHTTNFCARRHNRCKARGQEKEALFFQDKLIELYDFQLREGIVFQTADGENYIDHGDFKNIVVLFSRMGRFGWVQSFIETYSERILKNVRSIARNFALGILHFFMEKFGEAMRYIQLVRQELKDTHDRYYAESVRGYYLRILFEQGKLDQCERESVNIAKAIRRNVHLPRSEKQKPLQFCLHLNELCRSMAAPDAEKRGILQRLREKITTGPPSTSVDWLLQKIDAALI